MKPGFKTTEFWLTMVKAVVGPALAFLVASGTLAPDVVDEGDVTQYIEQIAGATMALVALFMSGRAVQTYTENRIGVKGAMIQAEAQVAVAAIQSKNPDGDGVAIGFSTEEDDDDDDEDYDEDDADNDGVFVQRNGSPFAVGLRPIRRGRKST